MIYNSNIVFNFVRIVMNYEKENYAYSYTELAQRLNLTRNQVIAIERRAMKKIKEIVNKTNKLKDYTEIFIHTDKYIKKYKK